MRWQILALAAGCVGLIILALVASGSNPVEVFGKLISGSFGTPANISGTLKETTPLLMLGLGVYLALKAGLFNIGIEGQFIVGAFTCAVIALRVPGPFGMLLGVAGGTVAGAVWALPAGWIRAYRGGHEVITTIMLNNVAALLTTALVAGPFKDPTDESPTTASLAASSQLHPILNQGGLQVSAAILIGTACVFALAWWLRRTVAGYELQAVGANPTAAKFAGVKAPQVILRAMCVSGALGGLAGGLQVLAYDGRFYQGFSPGYGFDALGVALLAGNSPIGLFPSALLFGVLQKGGTSIQFLGVPKGITYVILGFLIVIAATVRYRKVKNHD